MGGCAHQQSLNLLLLITADVHGEVWEWLVCSSGHLGVCPIGGHVCGSLPREIECSLYMNPTVDRWHHLIVVKFCDDQVVLLLRVEAGEGGAHLAREN